VWRRAAGLKPLPVSTRCRERWASTHREFVPASAAVGHLLCLRVEEPTPRWSEGAQRSHEEWVESRTNFAHLSNPLLRRAVDHVVKCKHEGFHTITSSYDRVRRVLIYFRRCDECGARVAEVRRLAYEPRFDRHGSDRFLPARPPVAQEEATEC
jgi:hypothetical protein